MRRVHGNLQPFVTLLVGHTRGWKLPHDDAIMKGGKKMFTSPMGICSVPLRVRRRRCAFITQYIIAAYENLSSKLERETRI